MPQAGDNAPDVPPSATNTEPLTSELAGEARNPTICAISQTLGDLDAFRASMAAALAYVRSFAGPGAVTAPASAP